MSLHVTIGINQLTWRGLIRQTTAALLDQVDDDHLPAGYLDDPSLLVDGLRQRLTRRADDLGALDPDTAAAAQVSRFLGSRHSRLRGGLVDRLAVRSLSATTTLRRRPGSACVVVDAAEPGRIVLLLGDRTLTVPGWLRPAVEQIPTSATFTPGGLPIDPQSQLVLCRRLVREGLLEVIA